MSGGNRGDRPQRLRFVARPAHWPAGNRRARLGSGARFRRRLPPRPRMTLRGRLTLLAGAALAAGMLWRFASDPAAAEAESPPRRVASQQVPQEISAPPRVPEALLRRLPPTARGDTEVALDPSRATRSGKEGARRPAPITERVARRPGLENVPGPLGIEYTLEPELTREVLRVLRRGRVALGHVIVLDPRDGRVLAYVATDAERLPAPRAYPAASLMKVVTTAAVLERAPGVARRPCRYVGSPYRLTRARLRPPRRGRSVSLRRALATSNNQCFAQLAVHTLGEEALLGQIARLGLLDRPAPGHEGGRVDAIGDALDLGRLGCGLDGCRITSLGAARLAALLADGELVAPYWIARVRDAAGRELRLPAQPVPQRVLSPRLARELREMLVETTQRGTARRAFRTRRGPLLGAIRVAGKTGSLTGRDPLGRYEWFIGVAPAERPRVAVATLVVQNDLWWISSAQLAAEVMKAVFCPSGVCRVEAARRWGVAALG